MDLKNKIYYVYEWFNVDTGEVFYVGKGKNSRYKDVRKRNKYFKNYYNKYNCDVRKVKVNINEYEAFEKEKELIKYYRSIKQCKCNIADGGEGATLDRNSREYALRKIQYIHDFRRDTCGMYNESDYDYNKVKNKSKEELIDMYNKYLEYKDNEKENKIYYEMTGYKPDVEDLNLQELKCKNSEIIMLTDLLFDKLKYNKYKNIKKIRGEYSVLYQCDNVDWTEFFTDMLNMIKENNYMLKIFIETVMYNFRFIKFACWKNKINHIFDDEKYNNLYEILAFNVREDNKIHIRISDKDNHSVRVNIKLIDLLLIFAISKDYDEVIDRFGSEILLTEIEK